MTVETGSGLIEDYRMAVRVGRRQGAATTAAKMAALRKEGFLLIMHIEVFILSKRSPVEIKLRVRPKAVTFNDTK
jgi:hypothetical protein